MSGQTSAGRLFVAWLLAVALASLASGCNYRVRIGEHDGGGPSACTPECTLGNQCVCGRCITLDLPPPACNPACEVADPGDYCDSEGASCLRDGCSVMRCAEGIWRLEMAACDGGLPCECPPPPPGCDYVGWPCPCSALQCEPQRCGRAVCEVGTTCCNASCGLCVPPGGSCGGLECPADCSPMEAVGEGPCDGFFGYAWDGSSCVGVGGCECIGSECGALFASVEECRATFAACPGRTCGTIAGLACDGATEYCDYGPSPHACGAADAAGECRPRPGSCETIYSPVCGCDGRTYGNECEANRAGFDAARSGACVDCEPDDARPIGTCRTIFGFAWTGTECVALACSCEGTDCVAVAGRDQATCLAAHGECAVPAGS